MLVICGADGLGALSHIKKTRKIAAVRLQLNGIGRLALDDDTDGGAQPGSSQERVSTKRQLCAHLLQMGKCRGEMHYKSRPKAKIGKSQVLIANTTV